MFSFPWWLAFLVGFLSLSEEILWVRVIGFRYEALPPAFSFVLICYLTGIAIGASAGKRLCAARTNLYAAAAIVLSVAAFADVLTPLYIGSLISPDDAHPPALAIIVTAAFKSALFPLVHHLGSEASGPRVGRSVSKIYFGNIAGATLGPLATGFVALDYLSVDECFVAIAAICVLASLACALRSSKPWLALASVGVAIGSTCVSVSFQLTHAGPGSLGKLTAGAPGSTTHFIANRHGVIHTSASAHGDLVFGGNVYDGMATANADTNANGLQRLYMLASLHPQPRHVLFVGLSAGAWVRATQGFPGVDNIEVVELNPGYVDLARAYPELAPLLEDPRVRIHIDDGRRWLKRNPDARFDAIVQNTTYHWRANTDNLLSREYFSEVRRHLRPGGIFVVNTTGSFDVLATGQAVFPYAYRYSNFMYASDHPLAPDPARLRAVLRPDGSPFDLHDPPPHSVAALLPTAHLDRTQDFLARRGATAGIITDDNLLTEYRDGRRFGPFLLRAILPPEPAHF